MTDSSEPRTPTPRWSPTLVAQLREASQPREAAECLAAAGVPVFPCVALEKRPLTTHGFHDASVDPDQIAGWWSRWPDANVAMPTGIASGIDVVDVDIHAEGNGYDAIRSARSSGLLGDPAWMVTTPSSGLHLCFLHADDVSQPSWQVPTRHVDFRGDGGYVVLPPSRVSQADDTVGRYEVVDIATHQPDSVDAGALRRFLEPKPPSRLPADLPVVGARPDRLAAWVASLSEGERNHGLFWASCRMAEAGERFDVTANVLGGAAQSAGLSDRESLTTIQSAYRIATRLGTDSTGSRCPRPTQAVEGVRL
ncbi:DNA replication protein [Aeromicrobium sp. A1-2]|uniref:bifunctional DNA primase/polymerase n=1 Tax=Aeromicrobium sp. A1-2 TaxID=2107713 RepID=UPI000E533C03|nr:bifunctional DNA primase/polymerase [Aeromicrobium sp. A1-2]AXT85080.1 DNA replication protein [Aeromicrobium sp. A1-2]